MHLYVISVLSSRVFVKCLYYRSTQSDVKSIVLQISASISYSPYRNCKNGVFACKLLQVAWIESNFHYIFMGKKKKRSRNRLILWLGDITKMPTIQAIIYCFSSSGLIANIISFGHKLPALLCLRTWQKGWLYREGYEGRSVEWKCNAHFWNL